MNELAPEAGNSAPQGAEQRRPEAKVIAEGDAAQAARLQEAAAHEAAESPEERCADIKIWVEAECDYFGIEPKNDPVADQITGILYDHELTQQERGRDGYDVTDEERRRLDRVIERGLSAAGDAQAEETLQQIAETESEKTAAETELIEATETAADDVEASEESYRALLESDEYQSASDAEKIVLMASHPDVPESERAKWQSFARILSVAAAVPEDHQLIVTRLNQLDMSQGAPEPMQFIQTAIFSSTDHDSGVSEATQDAIAAEFGIAPTRPARPRNATEMQTALREGRGTRPGIEIQEFEEPPGSGNWVEREVVVDEEVIPFTPQDKLMLSQEPPIGIFPDSAGSQTHRVEGVAAGQPIQAFELNIPEHGSLPSAEIHTQTNKNIYETIFRSRGLAGSYQALLGEGDSSLSTNSETANGVSDNDAMQGLNEMFFGLSDVSSRFLSSVEIQRVHDQGTRWLVPGGDFGSFTEVDTASAQARLRALFGDDPAQMAEGMRRATPIINSGGAVTPSFEALYAGLYPDDAANGYPRLREIVGDDGMAVLDLPATEQRN